MIFNKNEYIAEETNFRRLKMRKFLPFVLLLFVLISCKDEDDSVVTRKYDLDVEDFIWKGLNTYYYWQTAFPTWQTTDLIQENPMPTTYRISMENLNYFLNLSFQARIALAGS